MNTLDPSTLTSPRAYAAAVLAEAALDRRQWLMERCPVDWRAQVEEHVKSAFPKVAAYRRHRAGRDAREATGRTAPRCLSEATVRDQIRPRGRQCGYRQATQRHRQGGRMSLKTRVIGGAMAVRCRWLATTRGRNLTLPRPSDIPTICHGAL
ncbi:hypothetical protein [Ectopseudomonas oleovorans]|uniref:hypothetical protein n=1 Tax=Ectopseudomonas oleovorans TaxID=301 RepID=UPI003F1E1E56